MDGTIAVENEALILDLIELVANGPRPYDDVMNVWRTSYPSFPIWEDAIELGFIVCVRQQGTGWMVQATPAGRAFLRSERRP